MPTIRTHGPAAWVIAGFSFVLAGSLISPGTASGVPAVATVTRKPSPPPSSRPSGPIIPGGLLWIARYDGGMGDDQAHTLGVSPDGSKVFVSGFSRNSMNPDYATVAYDTATGAQLWVARYDGPANYDYATALKVSPDGSKVFVTGTSVGTQITNDYATVAYDASTGAQLWVARYNGSGDGDDSAYALAVSPDGSGVFVTGFSDGVQTGRDYATVAYEGSTGAERWVSRYDGPAHLNDLAVAIGVSPDGSDVFVTGTSAGAHTDYDYATVAYAASSGTKLWAKRYNGRANMNDGSAAVAVSPDGSRVFVTGFSVGPDRDDDYATLGYDAATGGKLWVKRYNGPASNIDDADAVVVSPDGSTVFVTGTSVGLGDDSFDYATVAYAASDGARRWLSRYNSGPGSTDQASALALTPDGSQIIVTGAFAVYDYGTVAYDASRGAQLWVRRYNVRANGQDEANCIGMSPDGSKVFVSGFSMGSKDFDYATVAYGIT
jgi:hypothetical protein